MKKFLSILVILILACSFVVFAEGEEGGNVAPAPEPAPEPPKEEPAPAPEPEPVHEPEPRHEPVPMPEPINDFKEPEPMHEPPMDDHMPEPVHYDDDMHHEPPKDDHMHEPMPYEGPKPYEEFRDEFDQHDDRHKEFDNVGEGFDDFYDKKPYDDRMPRPEPMPYEDHRHDEPEREGCWVGDRQVPCPGQGRADFKERHDVREGCKEIFDPVSGTIHLECEKRFERECPPFDEGKKEECDKNGGFPEVRRNHRGCEFVECRFEEQKEKDFFETSERECPSSEEMDRVSAKCKSMGMDSVIKRDGYCEHVECVDEYKDFEDKGKRCAEDDPGFRRKIRDECTEGGGRPVKDFDPMGCPITKCVHSEEDREQFCKKDIPKEVYEQCEKDGGREVAQRDEHGCVVFSRCVIRGDEKKVKFEKVEKVPEASKVLQIVLKLDALKMELDKLAETVKGIGGYYEENGDETTASNYEKASGMFAATKDKIDEIKAKLKDKLTTMTHQDLYDIKHDVKYIQEVVMKDIIWVMLGGEGSSGATLDEDDFEKAEELRGDEGFVDCGYDEWCFDKQVRVCNPALFKPDEETEVSIRGMVETNCIIKIDREGMGMGCEYPNYAFGIRDKNDLFPHCEGPLKDIIKEYGDDEGPRDDHRKYKKEFKGPKPRKEEWKCCQGLPQACIVKGEESCPLGTRDVQYGECPETFGSDNCVGHTNGEMIFCRETETSAGTCYPGQHGDIVDDGSRPPPDYTNKEERCMMECVPPDVRCGTPSGDAICLKCEKKCTKFYEGPCLTDEKWKEIESDCMNKGSHMETEPVVGESDDGRRCVTGLKCIDRSDEWGDQPAGDCLTDSEYKEKKAGCREKYGSGAGDKPVMGNSGKGYDCIIDIECIDHSLPEPDTSGLDQECIDAGALSQEACDQHLKDVEEVEPKCGDCASKCPGSSSTDCVNGECKCYYEEPEPVVEEEPEPEVEETEPETGAGPETPEPEPEQKEEPEPEPEPEPAPEPEPEASGNNEVV